MAGVEQGQVQELQAYQGLAASFAIQLTGQLAAGFGQPCACAKR